MFSSTLIHGLDILKRCTASIKPFLHRLGWMLAGEGVARVTRLLTAIVLSQYLSAFEFGIAAIVLSVDEMLKVLTRNGVGQKIIQCDEAQLNSVCHRVYQVNWILHIGLFCLQLVIAKPLAMAFNFPELQYLLLSLGVTYLIYPFAMVQVNLVQRQQDMKKTGSIFAAQVGTDNVLCAVFALCGMGIWSIVIPKLIVAPIWVLLYRKSHEWRFSRLEGKCALTDITEYSVSVFWVELLKTSRQHLDRFLIGFLIGVEGLGIYYFAVNAGSGFTIALIKAFTTVTMPDLCNRARNVACHESLVSCDWYQLYLSAMTRFFFIVVPVVLLQLFMAPVYVPVIFGQHWDMATPILMVLCAAALSQGFVDVGAQVFRASGKTRQDILINLMSTMTFFAAIGVGYWLAPLADTRLFYIAVAILMNTIMFAIGHFFLVKKIMAKPAERLVSHSSIFKQLDV